MSAVLWLVLLEAVAAVNRPALGRLEGDFALFTAVRADRLEVLAGLVSVVAVAAAVARTIRVSVGHYYSSWGILYTPSSPFFTNGPEHILNA